MYYVNVVDTAKVRYSRNDDIFLINLGGFDAPVLDDSEMEKYKWKLEDFDTEDDKWSNYPNKYDLEYSINNGKTVYINNLTLYTTKELSDYIKNGGEVSFGLKSDNGSDWKFNPEISDSLPYDTKVLKADILFKDICTDEDIDEEYGDEFFESVYRESFPDYNSFELHQRKSDKKVTIEINFKTAIDLIDYIELLMQNEEDYKDTAERFPGIVEFYHKLRKEFM